MNINVLHISELVGGAHEDSTSCFDPQKQNRRNATRKKDL